MMTLKHFLLAILCYAFALQSLGQIGIGQWRDHLTYNNTIAVAEGNNIGFCATASALFSHDPASGEITRFTTVNALNDVEIRSISWNDSLDILLVGYANGNLDLVRGENTTNMNDIKVSSLTGDKAVYEIVNNGHLAYLACGFGVVVVDLVKVEVSETWFIGPAGSQLKVNDIAFYNDSIHCATDDGLYVASANDPNLSAFSSWRKNLSIPYVQHGPFNTLEVFANELVLNYQSDLSDNDTLMRSVDGTNWQQIGAGVSLTNKNIRAANGRLVLTHGGFIDALDNTFSSVLTNYSYGSDFTVSNDGMWSTTGQFLVADGRFGMIRSPGFDLAELITPNGPRTTNVRRMNSSGGALYVATGEIQGNWDNLYKRHGIFHFQNDEWRSTSELNSSLMSTGVNIFGQSTVDILNVTVDPNDPDHAWATSWDEGLLEMRDRELVRVYNHTNSALQFDPAWNFNATDTNNVVRVAGLDYDEDGNLWMSNSNVAEPIVVLTADGDWFSYDPGTILNNNRLLGDVLCGNNGLKWIIRPRTNGLLVFDDNGTLSNSADDEYRVLNTTEGEGGLPSLDVLSIAEDYTGEIWVGTNKGIAVFFDPDAIFSGNDFDAQQILIEQDGNIQILLETEAISAIAADGAARKWIGTENSGVFLVSRDGTEELLHFTTDNSPLPSNTITALAVDGETGEVFIGTEYGIFSYRSDATDGIFPSDCATVFPNPVEPGYNGDIAIQGLTRESDVRITDAAGNLVYRASSNGGTAIWPGVNMQGEKVSSGVYIAFAMDSFGAGTCSTKILVVR